MQNHVQCTLQKSDSIQTAWIPQKFAKLWSFLEIKMEGGWDNGWQVILVGNIQPSDYVKESSRDYRNQREASDI